MRRFLLVINVVLCWCVYLPAVGVSKYDAGGVPDIHPKGWLLTLLQRQHDGLTGHPEALSYPYNSCLWAGEISRSDESYGDNWWRYEQTAYYTDGLLRLGYELNADEMVNKAMEGIEYTLANATDAGVLGNRSLVGITWPMSVYFRVLQAKYEHDGDQRIPAALEKHYLNFTDEDLAGGIVGGRNIMSLEGILWTYGKTGNENLLKLAEDAWAIQDKFAMDEKAITSSEPFYMHGVTFCEMLKLPLLLYAYTGKTKYLDLAMTAVRKIERESLLPDGVPSSAEFLVGNDVHHSHETCDIVDMTWTLQHYLAVTGEAEWADKIETAVYNAGLGAITKDFRSLQYLSSLNQFIATGSSNHNIYKYGSTWMAYRPTHETECCAGNINRMLPNMVSRMWMKDSEGGAVATIYGPSEAAFTTAQGNVTITCATEYPFDEVLTFTVSGEEGASIPLTLRIPTWCQNAAVTINGTAAAGVELKAGTFVRLPEMVKNGDVITLTLPMTVEKNLLEQQGIYFKRGPLLFSYAIPQNMEEDTDVYEDMHGKKSENPDFKCWNITPTGDFNYAYDDDGAQIQVNRPTVEKPSGAIPFDKQYTPVTLRLPVRQIEWKLVDNEYTPHLPEQGHLKLLDGERKYIELVPYGCTELRLTVFPDTKAQATVPPTPDYTRPSNAPECVKVEDGHYCAYFELPRFCWSEPVWCKVRKAGDDNVNLHSNMDGDKCVMVGTTANDRKIWKWTGPAITEEAPKEIIFTNHDLLTQIMPFANGGYYNYDHLMYKAGQTTPTGIHEVSGFQIQDAGDDAWYDLQGRRIEGVPTQKGIYVRNGKKVVIKNEWSKSANR